MMVITFRSISREFERVVAIFPNCVNIFCLDKTAELEKFYIGKICGFLHIFTILLLFGSDSVKLSQIRDLFYFINSFFQSKNSRNKWTSSDEKQIIAYLMTNKNQ